MWYVYYYIVVDLASCLYYMHKPLPDYPAGLTPVQLFNAPRLRPHLQRILFLTGTKPIINNTGSAWTNRTTMVVLYVKKINFGVRISQK